jgi:hypothetical protein
LQVASASAFAALVGHSPLRYQNELRLTLTREMLAKPNARGGEIGLSVKRLPRMTPIGFQIWV